MVPDTVALGHPGGAGPPGAVGSGASRVAASSGSRGGGTCQSPGPWGQSLQRSRAERASFPLRLLLPRGTVRVRPLRSLAEATVTPPPAGNPHLPTHSPPGGTRGKGRRRRRGGRRSQGAPPRSRPTVGPRPLPGPQRRGRTARAREAAPRLPAKASPRLPVRLRRGFFPSPGRWSLGSGAGRKTALGGASGASRRLGAGRDPAGASGSGCGEGAGPRLRWESSAATGRDG